MNPYRKAAERPVYNDDTRCSAVFEGERCHREAHRDGEHDFLPEEVIEGEFVDGPGEPRLAGLTYSAEDFLKMMRDTAEAFRKGMR